MKKLQKKKNINTYVDRFYKTLEQFQDKKYADLFLSKVNKIMNLEKNMGNFKKDLPLTRKIALSLFRMMRYKDEYEVARLHTSGEFAQNFLKPKPR